MPAWKVRLISNEPFINGTDAVSTRRALLQSQARQATLERRIVELQRKLSERDEEHENQRIHIESLSNERRILLEGETRERTEAEQKEKEWEDERVNCHAQLW